MSNARRRFLQQLVIAGYLGIQDVEIFAQSFTTSSSSKLKNAKIVIVGGGFGGAATAKYLKILSGGDIDVTLIDPDEQFISCPMSNLVLSGKISMAELTKSREFLIKNLGIRFICDTVIKIDSKTKKIRLKQGTEIGYDKLVLSPGVEMMWESIPTMMDSTLQNRFVHAMKAGPQTMILKNQLESMPNGGVFAISIPLAPYRCPPSPYERASQVANYLKKFKPKSKVLILDANAEITSKSVLFKKAWSTYYPEMIEYRNNHTLMDVDEKNNALLFEVQDDVKADVLNIIPPMRAGNIAFDHQLANINKRWCEVDFLTFESRVIPDIHILGDAIQSSTQTPKSAQVANGHAKICAKAIYHQLLDIPVDKNATFSSICYSFLSDTTAAHISTQHRFDISSNSMVVIPGSNTLSKIDSSEEYIAAVNWANTIWKDTFG